ncbi:hypothetical protein TKK_0011340 [Trichogramma kaykai]
MQNTLNHLKNLIFIVLMIPINRCDQNITNSFIVEYFLYRAPSMIVGFTCNQYESDFGLIKQFSRAKLKSMFWKLEQDVELASLIKTIYHKIGVFVDSRCQSSENVKLIFDEATNHQMFSELYYWLFLGSDLNESLSLINDNSFGLSTDFVLAIFEDNKSTLYDIYNPCKQKGGKLKLKQFGNWDKIHRLNIKFELNKVQRWNLDGIKLKMSGTIKNRPPNMPASNYMYDLNFKQFDRMTRLGYIMWMHLADKFNFTIEFNENNIGNDDDSDGPVMNTLFKGNIDASSTADRMSVERIGRVRAIYAVFPFRTCFIFRSTSSDLLSIRDIFLPFSSTVWYLTLGISIVSINALAFLSIFSNRNFYENYLQSIIIHVGAFCQQGTEFSSNSLSGRIAILHILLFNLLLYNYYLASAVSNRLSEPLVMINDSLHSLKKKNFQYASQPIPHFDNFIQSDDWETKSFYSSRWSHIPISQRFMSPDEGMAMVLKGGFAYHTDPETSYTYVNRHFDDRKICELQEVHLVRPIQYALFVHINSSFLEIFKAGFLRLTEVGIRYKQFQQWSADKPKCRSDILTAASITIKEVAPAIIFLFISTIISASILILEFMYSFYNARSMNFVTKFFSREIKIKDSAKCR